MQVWSTAAPLEGKCPRGRGVRTLSQNFKFRLVFRGKFLRERAGERKGACPVFGPRDSDRSIYLSIYLSGIRSWGEGSTRRCRPRSAARAAEKGGLSQKDDKAAQRPRCVFTPPSLSPSRFDRGVSVFFRTTRGIVGQSGTALLLLL